MQLAQFTSTDETVRAIYVNPANVIYVIGYEGKTGIGTTVADSAGNPWTLFVRETAEEVHLRMKLAMAGFLE